MVALEISAGFGRDVRRSARRSPAGTSSSDVWHQIPELAAQQRVHAGGRLVEDQQVRVVDQRAAQAEFLPHPAGQLPGRPVGERREVGGGEQIGGAPRAFLGPLPEQGGKRMRCPARSDPGKRFAQGPPACRRCARTRRGGAVRVKSPPNTRTSLVPGAPGCNRFAPASMASRVDLPTSSGPIARPCRRRATRSKRHAARLAYRTGGRHS